MRYRYLDQTGQPCLRCPKCGTRWDMPHGIVLVSCVDETVAYHKTRLSDEGWLVDVDRLVENGYHSTTECGDCGEQLINMEEVVEDDEAYTPRLRVTFKDARGVQIEWFDAGLDEAMNRIAEFVRLHGCDPDEDGEGAMRGTIVFEPLRSED